MVRAVALLGIWCAFDFSQAFFLAPTTTASACGAAGSASGAMGWSSSWCRRSRPTVCCSSSDRQDPGAEGRGRRAGSRRGALAMKQRVKDSLEEVSDELASKPVALECPKTGRTLVCYAERIAVVGGKRYLVAFPKDPAVAIAFDENGEVSPVPNDDPIMDELFPLAEACVADLGPDVTLLRTPTTLTIKGLNELVEEKSREEDDGDDEEGVAGPLEIEVEEEDEEDEDEEGDFEEADEVELLGEFLLEGEEFLIVRFLEPILILAKEQAPGRYFLIDEEEEQDAIPLVDEMLCGDASL